MLCFHPSKFKTAYLFFPPVKLIRSINQCKLVYFFLLLHRLRGFRAVIIQSSCLHSHPSIFSSFRSRRCCMLHASSLLTMCVWRQKLRRGSSVKLGAVCGAETTPVLCSRLLLLFLFSERPRFLPWFLHQTCVCSPRLVRAADARVCVKHAVLAKVCDGLVFWQERYGFTVVSHPLRGIGCQPLHLTCPRWQEIW